MEKLATDGVIRGVILKSLVKPLVKSNSRGHCVEHFRVVVSNVDSFKQLQFGKVCGVEAFVAE